MKMKQFLVLALMIFNHEFSSIEAGGGGDRLAQVPGCEKYKDFKDMDLKSCCASMPEPNFTGAHKDCKDCKDKDKNEKMCCFTDCKLKFLNMLNSTGFIDAELTKTELNKLVDNDEAWGKVISEVVDDCIKEAPAKLEEWKTKHPDMPPCETGVNIIISKCIRREGFFKCPVMDTSDKCKEYIEFGKGCEHFPFWGQHKQRKADD